MLPGRMVDRTLPAAGALLALSLILACAPAATPAAPTAAQPKAAPPSAPTVAPAAASAPPAASSAPAAKPSAPTGQATIAIPSFQQELLDPSKTTRVLQETGGLIFESLYLHFPPNGEVRPFLLESAGQMAQDGLSWTFKLKDGIRFSNGDPMTAEDVKFSLDRYRSDQSTTGTAAQFRQAIKEVVVVDKLTVRVQLNGPWVTLPISLAGRDGNEGIVLPKKYIEQVGWDTFAKQPIGSGPYKLVDHKTGDSMTLEAVPNHWRATPRFASVKLVAVPEEQARIAMLTAGQADMARITPSNKKKVEAAGFQTIVPPATTSWLVELWGSYGQYEDNPLRKLEVRKALTLALDKSAILDAVYGGAGQVVPYAVSVPGSTIGAPADIPATPYDPAGAKRLLAEAGYPNGFDITLFAPSSSGCSSADLWRTFASAVAGYWEQIGVRTQMRPIEFAVFRPMYTAKTFAPEIVGQANTLCPNTSAIALRDLVTYYWSKGLSKMTDVADAEIEKAQSARSLDELVQYSEAAYRKLYENYVAIGVFTSGSIWGVSKKVADVPTTAGFDNLLMWLVQEKP